jgi:hypothetical protein
MPSGAQFLLNAIAALHGELAKAFDRIKELEAENAKLKKPEVEG